MDVTIEWIGLLLCWQRLCCSLTIAAPCRIVGDFKPLTGKHENQLLIAGSPVSVEVS